MKLKLIIITVALFAAGIIGCILILNRKPEHPVAVITQDDKIIDRIDLSLVDKEYTFTIEGGNGARNVVSVRNGEIAVIEATCPDKVCVHMGYIKNSSMPITCLPNHVMIRIINSSENDIDIMSN